MILTDKRLAELRATAMRQCYSCGGYNEYEPCPTIVNMDGDEILALIDDLASLRADRDEAVGAALKVEQRNYDQAQEIKALRARIELAQGIMQEPYRDYLTEDQWNESKLDRLAQAIWGEPVQDDMEASHD